MSEGSAGRPLPDDRAGPPQVIPVPASSAPGPTPPWEGRTPDLRLTAVQSKLANPFDLHKRPEGSRASAVLAVLFEEEGETRVVLTRRASTLRNHRSEVAFPGGRVESGETLVQGALRETWEEVRIPPTEIEVVGTLSPLNTFTSNSNVNPFVGVHLGRPSYTTNPTEVEVAFDVALRELLACYRSELWGTGDVARVMHFFDLPSDIVWGATGRMLWELLARSAT